MPLELSIVIVNHRSWEPLRGCLESLLGTDGDSLPENTQVIVVDNASGDEQLHTFERDFPRVEFVLSARNGGFSRGCNLGAGRATGRELLFLNPDVIASPQTIQALLALKLSHAGVRILTLTQRDAGGRRQKVFGQFPNLSTALGLSRAILRLAQPGRHPDPRTIESSLLDVDWVSGSALMIDRAAFDALGGWNESFWMYYEDVDLCKRAQALGYRRCFTSDTELTHLHGGASRIDGRTRALTRSEVILSRHLYGHLHLTRFRAKVWHALTFLGRSMPRLVLGMLPFASPDRAYQKQLLWAYYAGVWRSGSWVSPRAQRDS